MATIILTTGIQQGEYYLLEKQGNIIGRSNSAALQVLDELVSRQHMNIYFDQTQNGYFAADLNSKYGVLVNGQKITVDAALKEGDRLAIGKTSFIYTESDFSDRESALAYFRQAGEWELPTLNVPSHPVNIGLGFQTPSENISRENNEKFIQWAGSTRTTLAIVFTDIVSSTMLTHQLGNEQMSQIRLAHFSQRDLVTRLNGYEIKNTGDGFMIAFHTAMDALDFALELYSNTGDRQIKIRTGIHIGPVTIEQHDIYGNIVSYTARIMNLAAEGGVCLSNEAKSHIDHEKHQRHQGLLWKKHADCSLKGFPGKHLIWSVMKSM